MRVAMRQLLSRKSHARLSEDENRNSQRVDRVGPVPFLPPSSLSGERVFPIRNQGDGDDIFGLFPHVPNESSRPNGKRVSQMNPPASRGSNGSKTLSMNGHPGSRDGDEQRKVSERTQYTASSKLGMPRVITGAVADTSKPAYRRCEDEPIHTPGAVQSFGALIGLKYSDRGDLEVRIASENSRKVLGYGPEQLFALSSFLNVLRNDVRDEVVARIDHALKNVGAIQEETRLDVFQMILTFPYEPEVRLWCAIHLASSPSGLVICEFEEYSDSFYLKDAAAARILPVVPVHSTDFDCSPEEFKKSTTSASKPLPAISIARKKQNKEFSSIDTFNAMTQAQKQISDCTSVEEVLDVIVGIISELTGFHRVMLYRFDSQKNGCVESELLNPQASSDIFRGLHYPASDIPPQARELYKKNRIRILHDRDAETARLVCRNDTDFEKPLDLTHSYLRAMSPIHNKYLANMGVRSSMSVSLVIDSDLWGLIACHGYGDIGIRVSLPIRELCRSIGEFAAINIQKLLMTQRIEARRLPTSNTSNFVASSATDLLKLVDAEFALLSIEGKVRAIGRMEPYEEALAVMSYLQSCRWNTIRSSQDIKTDFPGLSYPPGVNTLAGLLIIPLNVGEENDFLVFFRKGQVKQVNWAGNPNKKTFKAGSEYLEPRTSFQRWVETIAGKSKEWTQDQLETAAVLALLYGRFVETWRLKSGAATANQPNSETAEKSVENPTQIAEETFNLNLTASKILEALKKEAHRKSLDLNVSVHDQLPGMVKGDSFCFKQVLAYFTSNAFKQAMSAKLDINLIKTKDETSLIGIKIQDNGPGMTEEELDDIFHEFEQAQDGEDWLFPTKDPSPSLTDSHVDLTTIARYVRSVNGQIMVASEVGKGSIFTIELPFTHAPTSSEGPKSRKLRKLFLSSNGSRKDQNLPSIQSPLKSPNGNMNGSQRRVETPTHAERSFSPRPNAQPYRNGNGTNGNHEEFTHALSVYDEKHENNSQHSSTDSQFQPSSAPLNILVAEDDPKTLRMLDERLSQMGHTVDITCDGQECHDRFESNPGGVDVVLMGLQMPAVDGVLSTRMIRLLEREAKVAGTTNASKPRVPIIAVSAALDEDKRFDYIQSGIDGWILKPLDFRRLDVILQAVKDQKLKREGLYVPGQLKLGGWFMP